MNDRPLILQRYQLGAPLGRGGIATVYHGADTHTGQPVAIKLLKPEVVASDPEAVERFAREAEALRALDHPNIVKVLATAQEGGQHYLVMEFVPGGSLRDLLTRERRLPVARALEIALDLADALTRAHRLDIVHRDVKPANVLLGQDGAPRLSDFGMARVVSGSRLTQAGAALGTMHYLSPEACRGEQVDARADVWAFGVLLFELLVGRSPFEGDNPLAVVTAITTQPVPDVEALQPDAPVALADLVYRMLEKDREQRVPSARLVGAELEAIMQGTGAPPPELRRFATPTPQPLVAPRHNLPAQTTPFVGREAELAKLAQLLADPPTRLVTVLGPGGMGKTRLALEAAAAQLTAFERGVYLVPLASLSSADDVVPAVAEAVGFQFYKGAEPRQQLLGYLCRKHALLVMDNFEHVLDGAGLVGEILEAAPGVKVLVTSREKLNLAEETRFRIKGLSFPDWKKVSPDQAGYDAVKLFLQGARRARPGFAFEGDDVQHVARICQLVDGMPLGILLAAAWVEMFSPQEIAGEVGRGLDFLRTGLRDVPDRHRSLRAVFESTWDQLSESERETFVKLSVFSGFRREAARSVASAGLNTLIALVNKSLLRRDPTTGRYEMHELLRQYASEQLAKAGRVGTARDAHCAFFADFMHQREAHLRGRRQIEARDEIKADFENVRQAWRWAVGQKDYAAIERMTKSLDRFCHMQSRLHEGEELFRQVGEGLAPQPGDEPHPVWSRTLLPWYSLQIASHGHLEHYDDVTAQAKSSLASAQKRGDRLGIAHGLLMLGAIAENRRAFVKAIRYYEQSLDHFRELGDELWVPVSIGVCYRALGQLNKAVEFFQQALDQGRRAGDKVRIGWTLVHMGEVAVLGGDYAQAECCWQEAYTLLRESGAPAAVVWTLADLSLAAFFRGDYHKAETLAEEALEIALDVGHIFGVREAHVMLGHVAVVREDYAAGRRHFQEALSIDPTTLDANLGLSLAACGLGDYAMARQSLGAALRFTSGYGTPAMVMSYLPAAALILTHEGERERAVELLALAFHHPTSPLELLKKWPQVARLRAELETELDPEPFGAAWARGQALDLAVVLASLMDEFQASPPDSGLALPPTPGLKSAIAEPLSERERQVLQLLKSDLSGPEIARELVISLNTVRFHTKNIYGKLQVNNRRAAVRRADELGL